MRICDGAPPWRAGGADQGARKKTRRVRRPISRVLCRCFQDGNTAATIHLGRRLRDASCGLPGCPARRRACSRPSVASLFGLAPGGACRAPFLAVGAVGSYPTVSPLPGRERGSRRSDFCGAVPGPANRPAGISPAPFLRGARTFLSCGISPLAGAAARPPDPAVIRALRAAPSRRQSISTLKACSPSPISTAESEKLGAPNKARGSP